MTEDLSLDPGQDRSLLLVDDDEPFVKREVFGHAASRGL